MLKVLFVIHDLGRGGAEKVLVNLVNHMDPKLFDITVISLFGGGEQEKRLAQHIHYRSIFKTMLRGNSRIMKLFSPVQLHRQVVREHYDIEIAYLEGPDSRIISGCRDKNTIKINWVHGEQRTRKQGSRSFRSELEAEQCYNCFDTTVCVSETVRKDFTSIFRIDHPCNVLYNTVESGEILNSSYESAEEITEDDRFKLISVGTLKPVKGFDRLLRIVKRLTDESIHTCLYILGDGPDREKLEEYVRDNQLGDSVILLGYRSNPYKYVANTDLFVCSSYREGFSTAATEALIVGTPVCTTEVSGMKEMLGENNEWGIVTKNAEEALYQGVKQLVVDRGLYGFYKQKAIERGQLFSTERTVKAVEELLLKLGERINA